MRGQGAEELTELTQAEQKRLAKIAKSDIYREMERAESG